MVPATRVLDGFGAFTAPPATARPIPAGFTGRANADHPPGFYGPPEGLVAVNTLTPDDRPAPLDFAPLNARLDVYRHGEPLDLRGPVFVGAFALLLLDALVVFWLAGGLSSLRHRRARHRRADRLRPARRAWRCRSRRARRRRRQPPQPRRSFPRRRKNSP